jgi:hypothetical protein
MIAQQLEQAKTKLDALRQECDGILQQKEQAAAAFEAAPAGELVDVGALTAELQSAQRTNRAIDAREQYDRIQAEIDKKQAAADALTRRMQVREDQKAEKLAKAALPIEGLTFDDREVLYNGLPIANLGEGEQIRISTRIGMAMNPKLRVLCVRHGEALDEDGLKVLAEMAEKEDFQIWMARVDSSGKVGIVLEDGMITRRNEAE